MPHEELRLPGRRLDLIDFVTQLADRAFQQREWVEHTSMHWWATFDEVVHFLFDDTCLSESPEAYIGDFLYNQEEADRVHRTCDAIDAVLKRYGGRLTDAQYMEKPEWALVVSSAREALNALQVEGQSREA